MELSRATIFQVLNTCLKYSTKISRIVTILGHKQAKIEGSRISLGKKAMLTHKIRIRDHNSRGINKTDNQKLNKTPDIVRMHHRMPMRMIIIFQAGSE